MVNILGSSVNDIQKTLYSKETFSDGENSLVYYPERGGIITSLKIGGKEILYQGMLSETLQDSTKNVKGGIPFMFPNAGPLEKGKMYDLLPQHGTARKSVWEKSTNTPYEGIARFVDTENWGEKEYTYRLSHTFSFPKPSSFLLSSEIENFSLTPLPCAHGFHPYFDIPYGRKDEIIWDFPGASEVANNREIWQNDGTYRFDNPLCPLKVTIPGIGKIKIEVSPDFKRFWIWSLPGKSFICIEPVVGDEGTLINYPLLIEKGEKHHSFMKISLD